jgi:hypothetical protein
VPVHCKESCSRMRPPASPPRDWEACEQRFCTITCHNIPPLPLPPPPLPLPLPLFLALAGYDP